ncbi:hypothetical protein ElyMa_006349600 [Elysia marginata]|uniref:Uncharacterized protein n=1 Tax=Elysia marginata TaxID=1093978 RepID=A0AAV4HNQ9_9GAST|nr:hypothetical protein ElyMa_006349600 [Elysia marginata]
MSDASHLRNDHWELDSGQCCIPSSQVTPPSCFILAQCPPRDKDDDDDDLVYDDDDDEDEDDDDELGRVTVVVGPAKLLYFQCMRQ